jgi:hypothetical protein
MLNSAVDGQCPPVKDVYKDVYRPPLRDVFKNIYQLPSSIEGG